MKTTAVVPTGKLAPETNEPVTVGTLQLSVAVGKVHCAIPDVEVDVIAIFAGQVVKTGFTVSLEQAVIVRLIFTVNEHVLLLFLASVAV